MKYYCFLAFLFIFRPGLAQNISELPFIEHLINKGNYHEVLHLIDNDSLSYDQSQLDSMYYYKGWAHYSLKNLEQSTNSFLNVGKQSSFYLKSQFFAGYNQIYLNNYQESRKIFGHLNIANERVSSLVNFELSGIDMLQGEWSQAIEKLKLVDLNIATINQQVIALTNICKEQEIHRSKSPFLAGIMSGLIPGSGKIYSGKTGEGIASMIATTGLGLITWENYHKLGFNNIKTIFFGSILAATYISNIYGSVISVRIIENEYKDVIHNQILFQLHIPLRNFFEL
jgi:TM2 domain-containing membrane protein YozV